MQGFRCYSTEWRLILVVFILMFFAADVLPVLAADINAAVTPANVLPNITSREFNITVSNADSYLNITEVRISLPTGMVFTEGTNYTNSTWPGNASFTNTSATEIVWGNLSINDTLVENGTDVLFKFNASVPDVSDTRFFNVSVYDNESSLNWTLLWADIDGASPVVALEYPENDTVFNSSGLEFNFTAIDNNATAMNCSLYVDGSLVDYNESTVNNVVTTLGASGMGVGEHNWTLSCRDGLGNEGNASRVFGLYPDIEVVSITWSSGNTSGTMDNHTGPGDNITVWAQVRNAGDFNLSENSTNVTFSLYWDSTGTLISTINFTNDTLTNGTLFWFQFPENITSGVTNGRHSIIVRADSAGNVTESNESNDFWLEKVVGYDVTINSVSPWYVQENVNMTVNVTVRYANGDSAQNLSMYNFSVGDTYGGASSGGFDYNSLVFNTSFDASKNGSGIYIFNISSWYGSDVPRPGYHNITVTVTTNNSFSGSSSGNEQYYLLVPVFNMFSLHHDTSYEINEGSSRSGYHIYLYNNGTANATNVVISAISSQDTSKLNTSTSCSAPKDIPNGTYADMCTVTFNAGHVGGDESIYVILTSVSGNSTLNNTFTATNLLSSNYIIIKNVADEGSTPPGDGGTSGGTGNCSSDSDCSETQKCESGSCVDVSCSDGEVVNHACVPYNYDVSITEYPQSVTILWGNNSNDTSVTIENTGEKRTTFELRVTSDASPTVTPQGCTLDPGEECTFDVSLSLTASIKVGNYSGTFKAYRTSHEDVSDTRSFYLLILPTEGQKAQIKADYQNITAIAQSLVNRFLALNASPAINDSDRASAQPLIDEIIMLLEQAEEYSGSEDYANMNTLIEQINSKLPYAETKVKELELKSGLTGGAGIWLWVAVAVVIVLAVALLAYMMLPQKGHYKRTSFIPRGGSSMSSLFNHKKFPLGSKNEEDREFDLLDYGSGYKKHKAFGYSYGTRTQMIKNIFSRLKPRGKGPQKSISEFVKESTTTE